MKKLLIDFSSSLIRTALVENFELTDLIIESRENISIVSNIYVGVVKNILPSQFVFLDIGQEKNAFLQLNDKKEEFLFEKNKAGNPKLRIKKGDHVLVQVTKDANGTKGSCVTSQLNFGGKFLVLLTNYSGGDIGVSKKITNEAERKRLKKIASKFLPKDFGLIMRTNSENKSEEEIKNEIDSLLSVCKKTIERGNFLKGTLPVRKENFSCTRAIKEIFTDDIDVVITNSESEIENILSAINLVSEKKFSSVTLHNEQTLLFNFYGLETYIEKLLNKKIWLKSGGFLIIEETEACVVIDVNSGKFEGKKNHAESVFKINQEALFEICNQIKLRNLSGMIIIDFIDMQRQEYIDKLQKLLEVELKKDRVSTTIVGMTKLGLMQLTRKKTREPISHILQNKCYNCSGTGLVFNENYIVDRIYKSLDTILSGNYYNKIYIRSSKKIITLLNKTYSLEKEFAQKYNAKISFEIIETYKTDYFEIEKERINYE